MAMVPRELRDIEFDAKLWKESQAFLNVSVFLQARAAVATDMF